MRRRADPRKTTPLREPGGHDGHGADDHVKPIKRRPSFESRPRPIGDVLAAFREWLHLPDPAVVEVACGAVVANRVETFDPTWLLLIGAAGSGKTEALNATSRLEEVHAVASITEASLLSGSPRKDGAKGASGGLLREIGDSGLIVIKDFGSILSLHREARAGVLAALREVYDGSWTRRVGSDGGKVLPAAESAPDLTLSLQIAGS